MTCILFLSVAVFLLLLPDIIYMYIALKISQAFAKAIKHVCDMNTPSNPRLLYSNTGVCRGKPIFLIFAQNIDCGYTSEPPRPGGSNEYPQSMFWSKNKKNRYTPAYPSFTIIKVGYKGVYITRTCYS